MGARSFGKGLVQRPMKLTYGTQLKVTISRYYTASGRCIQALDYWNRDESGNAVKNTEFKEFKTRNGRNVQDGGGVLPDIEIDAAKTTSLTRALLSSNTIFDYATEYHYKHKVEGLSTFSFTQTDFEDFKYFVSQSNFTFETKAQKALREALSAEDKEIYGSNVQEGYKNLLAEMEKSKLDALDTFKKEIQKNLEDEILKRYFYREGLYRYYLQKDEAILAATELLANQNAYSAILK